MGKVGYGKRKAAKKICRNDKYSTIQLPMGLFSIVNCFFVIRSTKKWKLFTFDTGFSYSLFNVCNVVAAF